MPKNNESSRGASPAKKMTVYFGCSMLGGYLFVKKEELAEFPRLIAGLGHEVASDHQTQPGIIEKEAKLEYTYIHDRDYRWLLESDMGVFEISNPSLGVGGEISDMIHMGKPILLLFKQGLEESVSAYMQGKAGSKYVGSRVECHAYQDLEDARNKIHAFIEAYRSHV
ncbi:MAG: hypothetical protein PVG99_05220 [Desulfobacteraceae bacterium]